jgi:serine/threonine protein kinase
MGVVYVAHDPVIDRQVAIKVYRGAGLASGMSEEELALARRLFLNEARAAGGLDHPNILRVFDAGDVDGDPYIVMEYVPGGATLRQYGGQGARVPVDEAVRMVSQCALALDYAHRRGVTHRDIKPANILLTPDGDVKLADFGIAVRASTTATMTLGAFGSPRYVSPEQARGESATNRSDLYSLGVVLYELLAGRPPFQSSNLPGLLDMVLRQEPAAVESIRPDIPPALAAAVRRALEKDPAQRFATGREMAEALAVVGQEQAAPSVPSGPEEQMRAVLGLRFFRDFTQLEVGEILKAGTWKTYRRGDTVLEQGARDLAFYVLVAGDASVVRDGREVATLTRGEVFGEMGYLSRGPRSASVLARTGVTALRVNGALNQWASLPCQLRLTRAFQEVLIDRLNRTSEALAKQRA